MKAAENIVRLPQPRRIMPALQRSQAVPFVAFESWVGARDRAASALLGGAKRLSLTGPAGTGKTVLIDHVARMLRTAGRSVTVQLADAEPTPPGAGTTLFVDEADRLTTAKLQVLLQAEGTVVLAGLATPGLRRIGNAVHITLEPLEQEATRQYIAQWLASSGRTPADLESRAVRRLAELSGGVPRLLATLLSAASWLAEANGAATIGTNHVEDAAELRSMSVSVPAEQPAQTPRRRGRVAWSVLLAGGVLAAAALVVASQLFHGETQAILDRAAALTGVAGKWAHTEPTDPVPAPVPNVAAKPASSAIAPPIRELPPLQQAMVPLQQPAVTQAAEPAPVPLPDVAQPSSSPLMVPALAEAWPLAAAPVVASSMAVPVVPKATSNDRLSAETVEFLMQRGREMLKLDDISAARLLFRRAADSGNAEAMLELGQSYDPASLADTGSIRMADQEEARRWYRRAVAAGSAKAAALLR